MLVKKKMSNMFKIYFVDAMKESSAEEMRTKRLVDIGIFLNLPFKKMHYV